jgi:hypothetical protein
MSSETDWLCPETNRSGIWLHFKIGRRNKGKAMCNHCPSVFSYFSSTTNFWRHLATAHQISRPPGPSASSSSSATTIGATAPASAGVATATAGASTSVAASPGLQRTIESSMSRVGKDPLNKVLARMASVDRLPFYTIASSLDIRNGLIAQGYKTPASDFGVRSAVTSYGYEVKAKIMALLAEKKADGYRFSVTLDEYTSAKNCRYCCINIHLPEGQYTSIGMVRVCGSLPAEKEAELLQNKLHEFDLSLDKDVIGITTDGARVMKKMGGILGIVHQLCHAHGLHLAVCDVLYKKILAPDAQDAEEEQEHNEDEEEEHEDDAHESGGWAEEEVVLPEAAVLTPNIDDVVKRVRKIVCMFRRSPVKNDTLQKYAKQDLGKELTLLLDSKTRWSSLLTMLKRFLKMKGIVPKALIDYQQSSLFLSDGELFLIKELVEALDVVECSTRALCQRDATLSSADQVFKFMIGKLRGLDSTFAAQLCDAVETRIGERRLVVLATLQGYLENPAFLDSVAENGSILCYANRNDIAKFARDLYVRLFAVRGADDFPVQQIIPEMEEAESSTAPQRSRSLELRDFLAQRGTSEAAGRNLGDSSSAADVLKALKREMAVFEATGKRPSLLEQLKNAVATLPPTSTEAERAFSAVAERAFSAVGLFVTKLCTSLSDASIDNLFLLRTHFMTAKNKK